MDPFCFWLVSKGFKRIFNFVRNELLFKWNWNANNFEYGKIRIYIWLGLFSIITNLFVVCRGQRVCLCLSGKGEYNIKTKHWLCHTEHTCCSVVFRAERYFAFSKLIFESNVKKRSIKHSRCVRMSIRKVDNFNLGHFYLHINRVYQYVIWSRYDEYATGFHNEYNANQIYSHRIRSDLFQFWCIIG